MRAPPITPLRARLRSAAYYAKHRTRLLAKSIQRRKSMTPERRKQEYHKYRNRILEYMRQRRKDPKARVAKQLRSRTSRLILRFNHSKTLSWARDFIGCPKEELMLHIQAQFRRGMAWNNYGSVWHIDHILPCSAFDLTKIEEQRRCFHYSNLQPMFAKENRVKSDKILPTQLRLMV